MKWEFWIITIVLLVLTALGGMAGLNTFIGSQQEHIAEKEQEVTALEDQVASLQEQLQPKPYYPPLEQSWISSGTGYRMDPMGGGTESLHKGVDLVAARGAPVTAVLSGVVAEHWPAPDGYYHGHPVYGGLVVIDHGGFFALYGHLSDSFVNEGDHIDAGQVIGLLGDTGIATGVHLHFEIVMDPLEYLERAWAQR